jgi:hypothetical protein
MFYLLFKSSVLKLDYFLLFSSAVQEVVLMTGGHVLETWLFPFFCRRSTIEIWSITIAAADRRRRAVGCAEHSAARSWALMCWASRTKRGQRGEYL